MKTCGIYLFNINTAKFLIGHVTCTKGAYSIPKGCFDSSDKNYFETAKRELKEETNIDLDTLNVKLITELEHVPYKEKVLITFLVLIDEHPQNINNIRCITSFENNKGEIQPEIDFHQWVSISEANHYLPISQKFNLKRIQAIVKNIDTVTY